MGVLLSLVWEKAEVEVAEVEVCYGMLQKSPSRVHDPFHFPYIRWAMVGVAAKRETLSGGYQGRRLEPARIPIVPEEAVAKGPRVACKMRSRFLYEHFTHMVRADISPVLISADTEKWRSRFRLCGFRLTVFGLPRLFRLLFLFLLWERIYHRVIHSRLYWVTLGIMTVRLRMEFG